LLCWGGRGMFRSEHNCVDNAQICLSQNTKAKHSQYHEKFIRGFPNTSPANLKHILRKHKCFFTASSFEAPISTCLSKCQQKHLGGSIFIPETYTQTTEMAQKSRFQRRNGASHLQSSSANETGKPNIRVQILAARVCLLEA
jgi:hypothetical protein